MARAESKHRHAIDRRALRAEIASRLGGLGAGFSLALVCILGALWLLSQGRDIAGFITLISTLGALVSVFVLGKIAKHGG